MSKNDKVMVLWQQDEDLQKIVAYFDALNPSNADSERIKRLALEKIREANEGEAQGHYQQPLSKTFILKGRLKYALATAAAFLLITISTVNNGHPLNMVTSPGNAQDQVMEMAAALEAMPSQSAGEETPILQSAGDEMPGLQSAKEKTPGLQSAQDRTSDDQRSQVNEHYETGLEIAQEITPFADMRYQPLDPHAELAKLRELEEFYTQLISATDVQEDIIDVQAVREAISKRINVLEERINQDNSH